MSWCFVFLLSTELTIVDNIRVLKDKDDSISSLQKTAHEKLSRIASLESEIEALQVSY